MSYGLPSDPTSTAPTSSGGGSGLFDDPTKLGWAQLGLNAVGSLLGGAQQAKMSAAEMAERRREFDKAFGLQTGGAAINAQHEIESAPLRDRVMYKLQQLLGQSPGAFKPHDIFNGGGVAQQGGYDQGKLQAGDAAYTPGAGGVSTALIQKFLASIGYGPAAAPPRGTTGAAGISREPTNNIPRGVVL